VAGVGESARRAAVLVPLYVDAGGLWVLLTRRAEDLPYHRGQIAAKFGRLGATPPGIDLVLWAIEQTSR